MPCFMYFLLFKPYETSPTELKPVPEVHSQRVQLKFRETFVMQGNACWRRLAAGVVLAWPLWASAQDAAPSLVTAPTQDPWAPALAQFAEADAQLAGRSGGVVFVGSSSLRLWSQLEATFARYSALNRGFGGSQLADCARHVPELVTRHRPDVVVVYAGDNDLASGRSPEQVLASFQSLAQQVHTALPNTRIAFVSIKPSPARQGWIGAIAQTNALVSDYVQTLPYLDYLDVYDAMLDARGAPRPELFGADQLHMNDSGYAIWQSVIGNYLQAVARRVPVQMAAQT